MRLFLSYDSDDREVAKRLCLGLRGAGHEVFFDHDDLPAGETFNLKILQAVDDCDLVVFLVSPASVAHGAYSLTELGFAERRWPNPARRVPPVFVRPTRIEDLPAYLRAISILTPRGDMVAEVVAAVDALARWRWVPSLKVVPWVALAVTLLVAISTVTYTERVKAGFQCREARVIADTAASRVLDLAVAAREYMSRLNAEMSRQSREDIRAFVDGADSPRERVAREARSSDALRQHWSDCNAYVGRINQLLKETGKALGTFSQACPNASGIKIVPLANRDCEPEDFSKVITLAEEIRGAVALGTDGATRGTDDFGE